MGITVCFRTHSFGSILFLKAMRSIAMLACQMDRNASGWQEDGEDPVWSTPGNGSPALPTGRYLSCILWKSPRVRECPSSKWSLSHLSGGGIGAGHAGRLDRQGSLAFERGGKLIIAGLGAVPKGHRKKRCTQSRNWEQVISLTIISLLVYCLNLWKR